MISINLMNFDTRTVLDLISLDTQLKEEILSILIEEEKLLSKKIKKNSTKSPDSKTELSYESTIPTIQDCLKMFLRKDLKRIELSILKGSIDLNKVSYQEIIDSVRNLK